MQSRLVTTHHSVSLYVCMCVCVYMSIDQHHAIQACDNISELIDSLHTHLHPSNANNKLARFLVEPLRSLIVGRYISSYFYSYHVYDVSFLFFSFDLCFIILAKMPLTSLFPIVDLEMMARTPVQTNRRFRDDG